MTSKQESLEKLIIQVVGTREEKESSIRQNFEQYEWPSIRQENLEFYKGSTEEKIKEWSLNDSLDSGLCFYDNFKKHLENIANPFIFTKLTEQDRRNLLKFASLRKNQSQFSQELFAQQKLKYYLDLRENQPLKNVETLNEWLFGENGSALPPLRYFSVKQISPRHLIKEECKGWCEKIKVEVPRIYNWAMKNQKAKIKYETIGTYQAEEAKRELSSLEEGNFLGLKLLMDYGDSFVGNREMTETEWKALNSIRENLLVNTLLKNRRHGSSSSFLYEWEGPHRKPKTIKFPEGLDREVKYMEGNSLIFKDGVPSAKYERVLDHQSKRKSIVVYDIDNSIFWETEEDIINKREAEEVQYSGLKGFEELMKGGKIK